MKAMEEREFWDLVSFYLNGSDEAEIRYRLSSILNMETEEVSFTDLIERLACHFNTNCTNTVASTVHIPAVLQHTVHFMRTFYLPVIIFFGISGNAVTIVVFGFTRMRHTVPVHFLLAISLVDMGFLISLLTVWLENFKAGIHTSEGFCQLTIYLSCLCTYLSVWYLTGLTLERFLVVCVYSCRKQICSKSRAKVTVYVLGISAGVIYLYLTWTSGVVSGNGGHVCSLLPQFVAVLSIVTQIETVACLMTPYLFICILNTFILCGLVKQIKHMAQTREDDFSDGVRLAARNRTAFQMRISRVSVVLCIVSVVLTLPCHSLRLKGMFSSSSGIDLLQFSQNDFLWQEIFQYAFYTKSSVSFVIYFFLARSFRKALKSLLLGCKKAYLPCFSQSVNLDSTLPMECYQPVADAEFSVTSTEIHGDNLNHPVP